MTVAELIAKAAPALGELDDFLAQLVVDYPDAADIIQPKLDALRAASTADGLFQLGKEVMAELAALPKTGIDPRLHRSDLAG